MEILRIFGVIKGRFLNRSEGQISDPDYPKKQPGLWFNLYRLRHRKTGRQTSPNRAGPEGLIVPARRTISLGGTKAIIAQESSSLSALQGHPGTHKIETKNQEQFTSVEI